ncbi:MAG: DUF262 domain-containing protein [Planctomycetota bacterium]|nr:DUF262 domain-containing protein [Planctomycetota bacterium]
MSLENIEIKLDGIGHAICEGNLAVPLYQRSYAWEEQHVRELLEDLASSISAKEAEYFLGSIVLIGKSGKALEVVDGQQRLATAMILIAAVRDYFLSVEDDRAHDIERDYLAKRDLNSRERLPKLKLNQTDREFFDKRILSGLDDPGRKVEATKESHRRIAKAAELAAEHVKSMVSVHGTDAAKHLLELIYFLTNRAKVILVRVPDHANAFTIFETLNDRGLDLALSDLLKNYLFHLADTRILEVQQRWIAMHGTLEAVQEEGIVVHFIRHLWASKHGLTRERYLYDQIKRKTTSKQAAIDFAEELAESAIIYAAILNPDHEMWKKYGGSAKAHMSTLNMMGMIQVRPLVLAVLAEFTVPEVRKTLKALVAWAVRFLVAGGRGGTLENHYSERAKEIRDKKITTANQLWKAMQGLVPPDDDFETAFAIASVSKAGLARYYLQVLERFKAGKPDAEIVPNTNEDEVNLEHVLPQTASKSWKHVDPETTRAYHKRLGNMALMKAKSNVAAANNSFANKAAFYKTSELLLTSSIASYQKWGKTEIEARQRELAELAVKAWPDKP